MNLHEPSACGTILGNSTACTSRGCGVAPATMALTASRHQTSLGADLRVTHAARILTAGVLTHRWPGGQPIQEVGMSTRKRIARFTFLQDDWGHVFVRDESNQPVSLAELQTWVDKFAENPASQYTTPETERALLEKYHETFRRTGKRGYVYVVKGRNGQFKIGHTVQLKQRIKALRDMNGGIVELVHVVLCHDRIAIEETLHNLFKEKHVDGEWFALTAEDIEVIRARDEA